MTATKQGELIVKKIVLTGFIVMAIALSIALTGIAQNTAVPQSSVRSSVAVVDLMKIMREWKFVTAKVEEIKTRYQPREAAWKTRAEDFQKQGAALQQMKVGSVEYLSQENELLKKKQDLEVDRGIMMKQQSEEVAKVFQDAYKYVKDHSAYYARQRGISCVIQINSTPEFQTFSPQAGMLQTTEGEISSRQVVWYEGSIDLTEQILTRLNSGVSSNTAKTNTGAAATTANRAAGTTR